MSPEVKCVLVSCLGAVCQEVLHWYNLRNKLSEPDFKNAGKSKWYWIITISMIIISGIGTYFLFFDDIQGKSKVEFIFGAAFPSLLKKLIETKSNEGHHLGSNDNSFTDVAKMYFL